MGDLIYRPLMEDMTWSYSRIECFHDCPYRFFLKYIKECKEKPQFYSSYGSFMHKLIEKVSRDETYKEKLTTKFLFDFTSEVKGQRPAESTVLKYIECGCKYLSSFSPFPFNMIDVEKKIEFQIYGVNFVGILDYIGERDGELCIVDNKSRDLKPRSKRKQPTAKDKELDAMLRQLYVYSAAVKQEYGKFPKYLCFNCFKSGVFIEEPFDMAAYESTIEWLMKSIEEIKDADDFCPSMDYFGCTYICGVHDDCCYYEMR